MYICPECGTEYTVVPDACAVCGHEPDADAQLDLFAKAAEQERKAAEQLRLRKDQYQEQAAERFAAKKEQSAKDAPAVFPDAPEQENDAQTPVQEAKSAPVQRKGRSRIGLKTAAVCGAGAIALGAGAHFVPMIGKPAGFEKSAVGTFYMKESSIRDSADANNSQIKKSELWFLNGQTSETVCVAPEIKLEFPKLELPEHEDEALESYVASWQEEYINALLDASLYVSLDGQSFYYPQNITFNNDGHLEKCTLMKSGSEQEKVADIRLQEAAYNMENSWFYSSVMYSESSTLTEEPERYPMNPPYLVYGDAVYYRDTAGQLCCRQNEQTEIVAKYVERFWTMPGQEGVYYISVPDYETYKKEYKITDPLQMFRSDDECMNTQIPFTISENGGVVYQMHEDLYALYRTVPGGPAKRLITENIVDWEPLTRNNPEWLYYTVFLTDSNTTELRRYNFQENRSETVYTAGSDGKLSLMQDYPDGSCYIAYSKISDTTAGNQFSSFFEEFKRDLDETDGSYTSGFISIRDSSGNITHIKSNSGIPADLTDVYYKGADVEATLLMKCTDYLTGMPCTGQPYIWLRSFEYGTSRKHVYFRDQEITVTYDKESGVYTGVPLDSYSFSSDGTRLFGSITDYMAADRITSDDTLRMYGSPQKTLVGELNGAARVEMHLAATASDGAAILGLEQEDQPAEIICIKHDGMYAGTEKIASNVFSRCYLHQPQFRQFCFIANERKASSSGSDFIPLNEDYCGTLMRRADGKTDIIAENVTDYIPANRDQFAVICGEPGSAGAFLLCTADGYYQADTNATSLVGVRELANPRSLLDKLLA